MRSVSSLVLGLSAGTAAAALTTGFVLECPLAYADGGLYVRVNSAGSHLADLAGLLPANETFQLNLAVAEPDTSKCCGPDLFYLSKLISGSTFERLDQQPYIDVSEGAFAPVRFTDGPNSSLTGGETAWGWMDTYGFLMWSPTGHLEDVYPPPVDGTQQVYVQQGWQLVETEYDTIYQLYWSQDVFQSNLTNSLSYAAGQCYGAYSPKFSDSL